MTAPSMEGVDSLCLGHGELYNSSVITQPFKGSDEGFPIKWMQPHWRIWNQTSEWFLPLWMRPAVLAGGHEGSLGRRHDRISHGTLSSWIRVPRACHVGWSLGKEHLLPSLPGDPSVCQGLSRSMLTFINQIYSREGHKGRRGPVWKEREALE